MAEQGTPTVEDDLRDAIEQDDRNSVVEELRNRDAWPNS